MDSRSSHNLPLRERCVEVGIMSAREITFVILSEGPVLKTVRWSEGSIEYEGRLYDTLSFDAPSPEEGFAEACFELRDVTIGINFHWEQKRNLQYAGSLKFIVEGDLVTAVNVIGVEDYLLSVISSEMKSSASLEFLKAHAVVSRSYLLCRMADHSAHARYDVCSDDHCQRYQGIAMASGPTVRQAIDQTRGQVLEYDGRICDTRYSKCCGGRTERFSACWEDIDYPYLQPVDDNDGGRDFCDCEDAAVLSQVLNDYDLQTRDFYHWTVRRTGSEFGQLVKMRTGHDIGVITGMTPLSRGDSGRITNLELKGTLGSLTIGKELAIRRALSLSHLKSSAFDISRDGDFFVLSGRGWGHGVGLCQIGAAVMAAKGYDYIQILKHYYKGASVSR